MKTHLPQDVFTKFYTLFDTYLTYEFSHQDTYITACRFVAPGVDIFPHLNIISATFLFRDNKGQTPYIVAPDKDTRNVFRKYMGENPDRYDYRKAQVQCLQSNHEHASH